MKTKLEPLGAQVIAKKATPATKTKSGLYLPETAVEKTASVEVVAVGPEVKNIKIGDQIIFKEYESTDVKIDNIDYQIIKEEAILAKVKGDK